MSRVSVLVVSHESAADLAGCLASVRRQGEDVEVIVVDSGSRDGSLVAARDADPGARLIALGPNAGFAAAANRGLAAARGDLVVLLNPDAALEAGAIAALCDAAARRPAAGLLAPKVHRPDGRIETVGHLLAPSGLNGARGGGEADSGGHDAEREVGAPSGAAMAVRRRVIREAGPFEAGWFAYGDEADLALRAARLGWRTLAVPAARARHRGSADRAGKAYLVERNRIWVMASHLPLARGLADGAVRTGVAAGAALTGRGRLGRMDAGGLAGATLSAWRDGLRGLPRALRRRRALPGDRREAAALVRRHRLPLGWCPR
ncbi:MAG: glycosyltransferase [Thermoleophilia bacterium]|nr:glycosyltransferase [Thermoleophilia bacterium]